MIQISPITLDRGRRSARAGIAERTDSCRAPTRSSVWYSVPTRGVGRTLDVSLEVWSEARGRTVNITCLASDVLVGTPLVPIGAGNAVTPLRLRFKRVSNAPRGVWLYEIQNAC